MEAKKRLSPVRVLLAIFIGIIIIYGISLGYKRVSDEKKIADRKPWTAPYIDVTATPLYAFEQTSEASKQKNIVLAFIVSSSEENPCSPSWGRFYSLNGAGESLDLDRRIARFRQQGGNIAVSFGGQLNQELAINCKDEESLKNAYLAVINRYDIDTIDFDLEGEGVSNQEALIRRAKVVADIQKNRLAEGKNLAVWLTLPVATFGLTEKGTNAVTQMLSNGVDLAGLNAMTMNYGESREGASMAQATEQALEEAHRQLGVLYRQVGVNLSNIELWAKIGATPMIGQNDISGEIFTLNDATELNKFAVTKGIQRMSLWSANRDIQCGENYVNISVVSDSCSAIKQEKLEFLDILSQNFEGKIENSAGGSTTSSSPSEIAIDNPKESPYQIWTEIGTYLEGTKVVWRRNVYQAKWWTKGDLPDNPVLQSWETPWKLVGPVLPGETPIPEVTLAPGTYPGWSGVEIYEAGARVLLNGVPYQAKWWTQGDSPAASASNPDGSPWVILTQKEIEDI